MPTRPQIGFHSFARYGSKQDWWKCSGHSGHGLINISFRTKISVFTAYVPLYTNNTKKIKRFCGRSLGLFVIAWSKWNESQLARMVQLDRCSQWSSESISVASSCSLSLLVPGVWALQCCTTTIRLSRLRSLLHSILCRATRLSRTWSLSLHPQLSTVIVSRSSILHCLLFLSRQSAIVSQSSVLHHLSFLSCEFAIVSQSPVLHHLSVLSR